MDKEDAMIFIKYSYPAICFIAFVLCIIYFIWGITLWSFLAFIAGMIIGGMITFHVTESGV